MSSYGCFDSTGAASEGSWLSKGLPRKQDQQDDDRDWNSQQPQQNRHVRSPFVIWSLPGAWNQTTVLPRSVAQLSAFNRGQAGGERTE
jgi:hypothetical protein